MARVPAVYLDDATPLGPRWAAVVRRRLDQPLSTGWCLAGWLIARGTGLRRAAPKPAIELSEPTPDAAREEVNA